MNSDQAENIADPPASMAVPVVEVEILKAELSAPALFIQTTEAIPPVSDENTPGASEQKLNVVYTRTKISASDTASKGYSLIATEFV